MKGKLQILLIAYAFPPARQVGAFRAGYWFEELGKILDCEVSVITAEASARGDRVYVVPPASSSVLASFIRDQGLGWKKDIIRFLENQHALNPEVVIITGGPFMHFSLSGWLKKKYGSRIILDYRDPFATNPVFGDQGMKRMIKLHFERRFNSQADAIITVNHMCSLLISGFQDKKNAIIGNGYDERIALPVSEVVIPDPLQLIYTGKLYMDITPLQQAVAASGSKLWYAGPDGKGLDASDPATQSLGFITYAETMTYIGRSQVGVILLTGHPHLSTTKVFDYMRCGLVILVISDLRERKGEVAEILRDYPNVYWSANDEHSLRTVIEEIRTAPYVKPDPTMVARFSRANELQKLKKLILDLL